MNPSDATLAALLFFQIPGQSPYSTVEVDSCDERCRERPLCDEPVLACRPPHQSRARNTWLRYERFDEGARRYAMISDVITEVARASTREPDACDDDDDGCAVLRRSRPWTGGEDQLRFLVATVISHESTLRRDVHEGTTRGDCDYRDVGGRQVPIEGSCRSHCLGQVMIEPGKRTRRGYRADDIVGLDRASTRRCIETVVDRLSDAHARCSSAPGTSSLRPACVLGIYGAVPGWQRDPRITARAKTYATFRSLRRPLTPEVLAALGRTPTSD